MPCGSCGGRKTPPGGPAAFNPTAQPRPSTNERGMYPLAGEDIMCEPYRGVFTGTTVFLIGYGTEWEKIFLRANRVEAYAYAQEHRVSFAQISVVQMCHDAVIELFGQ